MFKTNNLNFPYYFCHTHIIQYLLAINSSQKTKAQTNVQFLQVINQLEDARIEFIKTLQGEKGYSPGLFTWKTRSNVQMAIELLKIDETKKYIDPDYQKNLIQYFKMSFNHFKKYKISDEVNWKTEFDSHKHLIESYAMLDNYFDDKLKNELESSITDEVNTSFNDFFSRVEENKKKLKK